jgi:uncharacterized protein (DUF1684 family)
LGDVETSRSPGFAVFEHNADPVTLVASSGDEDGLSFAFRDATTGQGTYPAGRYLDALPPQQGKVVLDFNFAYNPPCAFTAFATCSLPPAENHLRIPVTAGERYDPAQAHA